MADVDTANLRTLNGGGLASGQSGVALLGKEIEGVIVVGVGSYAAENEALSGGGDNDFVGAGLPGYFPSRSFTVLCLPKSQGCRPNLATPLPCPTRYTACHTLCGHASRRTAPFTMPLATPIPLFFATPSHDADRRGHSEAEAVSTMTRSCLSPRRLCAAPQRRCAAP